MSNAIAQILKSDEIVAVIKAKDKADSAAKKAQRTKRPAQNPSKAKAPAVKVSAKALAIKYQLGAARPNAGRKLFAFTEAVLQLLGLYDGQRINRDTLTEIVGATAVSYHTRNKPNMDDAKDGLGLTTHGEAFFKQRTIDGLYDLQDVEDYKAIMTGGQADNRLVKNGAFIKPLSQ